MAHSNENLYTHGCIRTFTGKYVNPCEPNESLICIEDIAHALSMQPRFGGHLPVFYSVAQHCIRVAEQVDFDDKLGALLHDASEAYLIDVPRPVKKQLHNYHEIEDNLMKVIAKRFCFEWPMNDVVKRADEDQLQFEWDVYMIKAKPEVAFFYPPMSSRTAEVNFMHAFNNYYYYNITEG